MAEVLVLIICVPGAFALAAIIIVAIVDLRWWRKTTGRRDKRP